jgi:hypothetical protein
MKKVSSQHNEKCEISNAYICLHGLTTIETYNVIIMMNKDPNNENLERRNIYFRDIRSFSIIIFMVSLVTAVLINTQAGMKQVAEVFAFFALGNLIIGIASAAQSIKVRKYK